MCVQGEIITSLVPYTDDCAQRNRIVDLSQCSVLPPLVDSHLHLAMSASVDPQLRQEQLGWGYEQIGPLIAGHLGDHFHHGVLAVRDGGDGRGDVLRFAGETAGAENEPVEIFSPGPAWHRQGRYGGFIGRAVGAGEFLARAFDASCDQGRHCKVINSGLNSLKEFGRLTRAQFTRHELRPFVARAHGSGKKVMVHANGRQPVQEAVLAGCDSIEHGFFMGRDTLELLAERQVTWVPTAVVMQSFADLARQGRVDRNCIDPDVVERTLDHQLEQMSLGRELGVPMAVGTDAGCMGVFHGRAMACEMRLFLAAGFSLAEVIGCATRGGARLLGIEERLGRLEQGREASFLVKDGPPERLLESGKIRAVYVKGRLCGTGK